MTKETYEAVHKATLNSLKHGDNEEKLVASLIIVLAEIHDRLNDVVKEMKRKGK